MTTNPGSGLHKVGQLWFSTDAVILRAQDRIFRVFVAILKEKSTVFADMFTFPQSPSSDAETMDGVPVVTVHDDPVEMEVFLKAIFDSAFFMPPPAASDVSQTLGILRLAHRYDVPYLRRRALEHMGTLHPTRLPEWNFAKMFPLNSEKFAQRISTVEIATEVGALWLLSTACSRHSSTTRVGSPSAAQNVGLVCWAIRHRSIQPSKSSTSFSVRTTNAWTQ
ncbi:hypothetical protein C8R47DRAFT_1139204 [Mycena vitilis]|nr:hypothetical protein C8R47DRAFT_1139204 [Mycena vitilis]